MPAQLRRHRLVVGLEVQPRLDGQDVARPPAGRPGSGPPVALAQSCTSRPIMWPGAHSVQRRCRPQSGCSDSSALTGSTPRSARPSASTRAARAVIGLEVGAGPQLAPGPPPARPARYSYTWRCSAGAPAADREGPGHVGRVEGAHLDARVEQQQVAGAQRAVVAVPVQDRGVRPAGGDRVVAAAVALGPGPGGERALDVALGQAPRRERMSRATSQNPSVVASTAARSCAISQASLTSRSSDRTAVSSASRSGSTAGGLLLGLGVEAAGHQRLAEPGQPCRQLGQRPAGDAERLRAALQRAARADPQLAARRVGVELAVVPPGRRRQEQDVAGRRPRVDDQHARRGSGRRSARRSRCWAGTGRTGR